MLMHPRNFNNITNCSREKHWIELVSLSRSHSLRSSLLKHNSGIFTISLSKHLRLLNFVIIIKCSQIIVHEFPWVWVVCIRFNSEARSLPSNQANQLPCVSVIISATFSHNSSARNVSENVECLFICSLYRSSNVFIRINIHLSVWSFSVELFRVNFGEIPSTGNRCFVEINSLVRWWKLVHWTTLRALIRWLTLNAKPLARSFV